MDQEPQKYQLAWFKLSEFIRRGEKERALAIYKLLMHTVDDHAFAKQLEGDLLLFFNDQDATTSYLTAAQLYKKAGKLAQATAVYEHLVAQFPHEEPFLTALINCYRELGHPSRIVLTFGRLLAPLAHAQPAEIIAQAIDYLALTLNAAETASLYSILVIELAQQKNIDQKILDELVNKTIAYLSPKEREAFKHTLNTLVGGK